METSLHEILSAYADPIVGVSMRDLETQTSFEYNADRPFHAASTMKVPVMIEVFRQVENGRFSLDDSLKVANNFSSIVDGSPYVLTVDDDSDQEVYGQVDRSVSIRWLVERMVTTSSNLATNILIDFVTADSVQATIERIGTTTMKVYRGVEDLKAFRKGLNNTATANDLAILLEALATGSAVGPEADREMVDVLSRQEFNNIIPAGLPKGTRVAHKTGSITEVHHDAAIVYPDNRKPYILVVLTEGVADPDLSAKIGAEISASVYSELVATIH
jgi:beta-lactamase class A